MSDSIRRKSSSKQLLQNLIRVTAQRSQEDAEEVERERRRRAREKQRGEESPSWPERPQHNNLSHNTDTSNIKKTPPPLPVSKIDKRLEQYTHALEVSSKEGRSGVQAPTDLTNPTEPVASKKNLFEAGDAWNQNTISVTPSKDADGLKVGVADLINQWEIKHGGVLNKKNLWEGLTDTLSSGKESKEISAGKRYKFVVTGHGKYEKVPVDDDSEDANCQSVPHTIGPPGYSLCGLI
ncbi:hypothetical protein PAMA_000813 [Pampus argenteus]